MGQDRDILILAWLARQPTGFAYADEIPLAPRKALHRLSSENSSCGRLAGHQTIKMDKSSLRQARHFNKATNS